MHEDNNKICTGLETKDEYKKLYKSLSEGNFATTSQINPYTYLDIFSKDMEEGYSIIYLCLSSGLSSAYNSSLIAKSELKEKYPDLDLIPIDSKSATVGIGLILEKICENKNNGMSLLDNKNDIENKINGYKFHLSAYVDSLLHLKRGGRISASTLVVGSILNVKPLIKVTEDGKLENYEKKIGTKRAILHMANLYKEIGNMESKTVYISDADNNEASALLEKKILEINPNAIVKKTNLSLIIGTHVGQGAVILTFEKK